MNVQREETTMQNAEPFQRRKHNRYTAPVQASLIVSDSGGKAGEFPCRVLNLSRHGVCFEGPNNILPQDAAAELRFIFPDSSQGPSGVRVARRESVVGERILYSGELRFTCEDTRRKIHSLLRTLDEYRIKDRRREETPSTDTTHEMERWERDRRRNFGVFTEGASFATRVPGWKNMYTLFRRTESPRPARIIINGRELIWYGSTDYLGLSHDPRVIGAARRALERYGTRAGYRALNGTLSLHEEFEQELADFKGTESALVFSGGYLGNIAILTTLLKNGDVVFVDEKAHASIVEGCIFSGAKIVRFRHNGVDDLLSKIKRHKHHRSLLVVDGVYSVEGDLACLPQLHEVAAAEGIPLMVDDAHGFGVMGPKGGGTSEHFGLKGQIDLDVGTMSKSLGGIGGFVTCRRYVRDYLQHASKGFTFTVNLPAVVMAGLLETLKIIRSDTHLRSTLWSNVHRLRNGLKELGYPVGPSESAVMSIPVGHEDDTYDIVRMLEDRNVCVGPVFRPMVKKGEAKIRLSVSAAHTEQDLAVTLAAFAEIKPEFDVRAKTTGARLGS